MAVAGSDLIEATRRFGPGEALVGIVTSPAPESSWLPDYHPAEGCRGAPGAGRTGVVFLNAGLIHRVGPNRVYVRMARLLARRGIASLRFDLSGVGDSHAGRDPDVLRRWISETRHAISHLAAETGIERFVLAGNCSGAGLAFLAAREDDRVIAAALVNPQPRSTVRYFLRLAASQPNFWHRLLRGGSRYAMSAARMTGRSPQARHPATERAEGDLDGLLGRGCRILLVSCEWDASYDGVYRPLRRRYGSAHGAVGFTLIPGANHDFSTVASQDRLVDAVCDWVTSLAGERAGTCAEAAEGRR